MSMDGYAIDPAPAKKIASDVMAALSKVSRQDAVISGAIDDAMGTVTVANVSYALSALWNEAIGVESANIQGRLRQSADVLKSTVNAYEWADEVSMGRTESSAAIFFSTPIEANVSERKVFGE